jgi:autoinducer 2-degrading protein
VIAVLIQLLSKPGCEGELMALLRGARAWAGTSEPGCLAYGVTRSATDARRFVVFQTYRDEEALNLHRQTPHARELGSQLPSILDGPAQVEFLQVVT